MVYKKPVKKKKGQQTFNSEFIRVRTPKNKEIIGIVLQRLGSSRIKVAVMDGKTRVCRIPGRLKRSLWVRDNNFVLVEPWEFGGDEKGDVIYKYRPAQVVWLKRKGHIKEVTVDLDEF